MFFLTILEKSKEARLKVSKVSIMLSSKMRNYEESRDKVTNNQLNKLKSAAKNKSGTALTMIQKNFQSKELRYELLLATRQKNKKRNAFTNYILTL